MDASRYKDMYKCRGAQPSMRVQRQSKVSKQRENSRNTMMMERRQIDANCLTPVTPLAEKPHSEKPQVEVKDERLEMLRKWQREKQQRLQQQKASANPLFKVYRCSPTDRKDLTKIYGEIKGKPIRTKKKPVHKKVEQPPLVPSESYKFKPPPNIKAINLKTSHGAEAAPVKRQLAIKIQPTTKSQSTLKSQPSGVMRVTRSQSKKQAHSVEPKQTCTPTNNRKNSILNEVVYISPFVTKSRGKENARKEFHWRSMHGGSDNDKSTSPKTAAVYFYGLLEDETERLKMICKEWNAYKSENDPPEEACNVINVAIGQTDLLLNKKFQQFRGLVEACETGNSQKPITCLDLHGFWDMVMIQVKNLDKRFENLEKLKESNWEELLPVANPPEQGKPKKKAAAKPKTKASSTTGLRAAIREARLKKATATGAENEDVCIFTPSKKTFQEHPARTSRYSTRLSTNMGAAKISRISSPGLTMMKVTQATKFVGRQSKKSTPITKEPQTTPKSILKKQVKPELQKSKVVLFNENYETDEENDMSSPNLVSCSPLREHRTRSKRNQDF